MELYYSPRTGQFSTDSESEISVEQARAIVSRAVAAGENLPINAAMQTVLAFNWDLERAKAYWG